MVSSDSVGVGLDFSSGIILLFLLLLSDVAGKRCLAFVFVDSRLLLALLDLTRGASDGTVKLAVFFLISISSSALLDLARGVSYGTLGLAIL